MKQTENYGFEKPDIKEFFKLETWKNNMDKIDETIKKREAEQKITNEEIKKIKNVQFTQADERKNIESKETLPVLFGKIAKWLADLKTVAFSGNYNDLSNKPTIPAVVNNNTTTEAGFALDARQANPNVDGSLAKQISALNSSLANKSYIKIIKGDWSGLMGTLTPLFNTGNKVINLIAHNELDDTYPDVCVGRADADRDGNDILTTYLKKADAKNNVSSLSNTMTNYNDQTPVVQYFTVPDDGYYLVTGLVTFGSNANGFREVFITNTTSNYVMGRVRVPAVSGSAVTLQVTSGGTFGPGQNGTLSTYQNSGSNLNVQEWLSMVKIAPKL